MTYDYRLASQKFVIRPAEYWDEKRKSGGTVEGLEKHGRHGYLYRGISQAEFNYIRANKHIKSNMASSFKQEGTCFGDDWATAENYTNYGRTDPRLTGKPNYIIEVKQSAVFKRDGDGYWKTLEAVPIDEITRVWKMEAEGDAVVAELFSI